MSKRGYTADGKAALFAHKIGFGFHNRLANQGGKFALIYTVAAADQHQHRTAGGLVRKISDLTI